MKKYSIKIIFVFILFSLFTLPAFATKDSPLKVIIPKKTGSYMPGDSIQISWTPSSVPVQTITLIPAEKNNLKSFAIYSDKVYGDPIITSGKFKYTFENYSISTGSYYVGISSSSSDEIKAQSSKK